MEERGSYTAFRGFSQVATGDLESVLTTIVGKSDAGSDERLMLFEDESGRTVDFDLRGTIDEVLARALPPEPRRGPGRPRLGVVSREVSLLPRHWEWLARQPYGASGTLRRLVDAARKEGSRDEERRRRVEAAAQFMWTIAGDLPGFEEASRALYAHRWETFDRQIAPWPDDLRSHLARLLAPAREAD